MAEIKSSEVTMIRESGLFDVEFYLNTYPDVRDANVDPVEHYLEHGAFEGRNPSRSFNTNDYRNDENVNSYLHTNPLISFILATNLRNSKELAARDSQLTEAPGRDADGTDDDPKSRIIDLSSSLSDGSFLSKIEFLQSVSEQDALKIIRPSVNAEYYTRVYPDIDISLVDPALHFLIYGWRELRDPNAIFNSKYYIEQIGLGLKSNVNPLLHYIIFGEKEGIVTVPPDGSHYIKLIASYEQDMVRKSITPFVDQDFYKDFYPDIEIANVDPIEHYLIDGHREGRDPSAQFSTEYYRNSVEGLRESGLNPLLHYAEIGRAIGLRTFAPSTGGKVARLLSGSRVVSNLAVRTLLLGADPKNGKICGTFDKNCLKIAWVIPDFFAGGGGHMTIFRTIRQLELLGHICSIWIVSPEPNHPLDERLRIIFNHYQPVKASITVVTDENQPLLFNLEADAIIATSWDTAYYVNSCENCLEKFYFVQDYEPLFYPRGVRSVAAEATYDFEFGFICASPWLSGIMTSKNKWARHFYLAADENYEDRPKAHSQNNILRIAFYSRAYTDRRVVEFGLLALEILSKRGLNFKVDFFGSDKLFDVAPFEAENHGILSANDLCKLYNECDIGVCFSATNYSLVPQEMMACGLAVLELDVESTRAVFPDNVVAFARANPYDIADKLAALISNPMLRSDVAAAGKAWAANFSWSKSIKMVESALKERLLEKRHEARNIPLSVVRSSLKVTVVIPTYNGGQLFKTVLQKAVSQITLWPFEILIIDSGSADGTADYAESFGGNVRFKSISKSEFGHGRTRNLGVEMSSAQYVAFLTQDALPTNDFWLYDLVSLLDRFPNVGGVFGPHLPWPDADPFTKRDLARHFSQFKTGPIVVSKATDHERWERDQEWRQLLHFYSDNNSCLRRSVWEQIPLPNVEYGEDQLWVYNIINAGFGKGFAPSAYVFHSHSYNEEQTFARSRTEAQFFEEWFGYDFKPKNVERLVRELSGRDRLWGARNGASLEEINLKCRLNACRIAGYAAGSVRGVKFKSSF